MLECRSILFSRNYAHYRAASESDSLSTRDAEGPAAHRRSVSVVGPFGPLGEELRRYCSPACVALTSVLPVSVV